MLPPRLRKTLRAFSALILLSHFAALSASAADGIAFLQGTETTLGANLNSTTVAPLRWSSSSFDPAIYAHSTSSNPETLSVLAAGDYLVAATLPVNTNIERATVRLEVFVNGVSVPGSIAESSYMRTASGHDESSNHVSVLLNGLAVNDTIQARVVKSANRNPGGSPFINITGVASMYVERVQPGRTVFNATATRTLASTNLNAATPSALEWTSIRADSGYTHSNASNAEQITLDDAGTYLVFVNMPYESSSSARNNPRLHVQLDGVTVPGGLGQQGYMRRDTNDPIPHERASGHWSGIVQTTSASQILSIQMQREASTGVVSVPAGTAGSIYIERIADTAVYFSRATQLGGGANWNPAAAQSVLWQTDELIDTDYYTHSTSTDPENISVNLDGDYLLLYNDAINSSGQRVNTRAKILVNGVALAGAETSSHYIRAQSGHNDSSGTLAYYLEDLNAGDVIRLDIERESTTATAANDVADAILALIAKEARVVLSGRITDAVSSAGVAGISVNAGSLGTTMTDAMGNYSFPDAVVGQSYTITPSTTGYEYTPTSLMVSVGPTASTGNDFSALRNDLLISGTLLDDMSNPIVGATITNSVNSTTAMTNASGVYQFSNQLDGSSYTLSVSAPGSFLYAPAMISGMLAGADATGNDFTGTPVFTLSGSVQRPGNVPVSGVQVTATDTAMNSYSATTNAAGMYTIISLPAEDYTLTATLPGESFAPGFSNPVTISTANVNGIDFVASSDSTYSLSGTVATASAQGIPGFQVVLSASGFSTQSTMTDASGNYSFSGISSGSYALAASKMSFTASAQFAVPVSISSADRMDLDYLVACVSGTVLQGSECITPGVQPDAPSGLMASDGTSSSAVVVSWMPAANAVSYTLFRSQYEGVLGEVLASQLTTNFYNDTAAVPGVTYYYAVQAVNPFGESGLAGPDDGFRDNPGADPDTDGDGESDASELSDGTDPLDPGSFYTTLHSPAYATYNTFFNQENYLTLLASGSLSVSPLVTVYDLAGNAVASQQYFLNAGEQFDVPVSTLVGVADTYGVVKIEWNDVHPNARLSGRMMKFSVNPDGSHAFVISNELRNPSRGRVSAIANSIDAQGQGNLIANWLEISNLSELSARFTANLYSQTGSLLSSEAVTLAPLAKRDLAAGHQYGQGVYHLEVLPADGATAYFARLNRYGSKSATPLSQADLNYAFSADARSATAAPIYAQVANLQGGCWTQSNYVELLNVSKGVTTPGIIVRDQSGQLVEFSAAPLAPNAQIHLNTAAMLPAGETGLIQIIPSAPGSIIAEAAFYFHDCERNVLQSAYATRLRIPGRVSQQGSFNSFRLMKNEVRISQTGAMADFTTIELFLPPLGVLSDITALSGNETAVVHLNQLPGFPAMSVYGQLRVISLLDRSNLVTNLLSRELPGARIDFALPLEVQ